MFLESLLLPPPTDLNKIEESREDSLQRLGLISKVGSGLYSLRPLGKVIFDNVVSIITHEMLATGASPVSFSTLSPSQLWNESGRLASFGHALIQVNAGKKKFILNPTHEEMAVQMLRGYLKSYKQLPINLFSIQKVYRDEPRPRQELLRTLEFTMADSYSFHFSTECAENHFQKMERAFSRVFSQLNLPVSKVTADNGLIGGEVSTEFQYFHEKGESTIASCSNGHYIDSVIVAKKLRCPNCGDDNFEYKNGVEVAHIFLLDRLYTEKLGLQFLGKDNQRHYPYMGCTGIGVSRLVHCLFLNSIKNTQLAWPKSIQPFKCYLYQETKTTKGLTLYNKIISSGYSVIYDGISNMKEARLISRKILAVDYFITITEKQINVQNLNFSDNILSFNCVNELIEFLSTQTI